LQVGIQGEEYAVFTEEGSKKVQWQPVQGTGKLLSWYKVMVTGILKSCKLFKGDSI